MRRYTASILVGTIAFSTLSSLALAGNPKVGGAAMFTDKNIVENAMNSKDHTTLVVAVKAAGLAKTLQSKGPFTVFAPTNEAFDALPKGTVETLLKPENKDQLTRILTCHVVAAEAFSSDIMKMIDADEGEHPIKTIGGCVLTAKHSGGKIMIEDENGNVADVIIADVDQSNGVIHVIDKVLLPRM